jgi:hypothetical protein
LSVYCEGIVSSCDHPSLPAGEHTFLATSRGGYYRRYPDGGLFSRQTPTAELEQI